MTATQDTELAFAGPVALAARVRDKEVSPRELVELYLRRIEALNPRLNALRTVLAEQALAEADKAKPEGRVGRGPDRGQGRPDVRRAGGHQRLAQLRAAGPG